MDTRNRQSKVQVFAKSPLLYFAIEVASRRAHQPHIHGKLLLASHPAQGLGFNRSQQTCLQCQIEIAQFIDKECSTSGHFHTPAPRLHRSGEGPFLVTQELGFEQARWRRRAIKNHERPARAAAFGVNGLGDGLFSRARFAFDEKRNVAFGQLRQQRVQATHLETGAERSTKPCHDGKSGGRVSQSLDENRRISDGDSFTTAEQARLDAKPIDQRAIEAALIDAPHRRSDVFARDVTTRDTLIGQTKVAPFGVPEQPGPGLRSIDGQRTTRLRPVEDRQSKGVKRLPGADLSLKRFLVLIHPAKLMATRTALNFWGEVTSVVNTGRWLEEPDEHASAAQYGGTDQQYIGPHPGCSELANVEGIARSGAGLPRTLKA